PPLALVYPDLIVIRVTPAARGKEKREVLTICACGVIGTPEATGWMGECCSVCHDRREERQKPLTAPKTERSATIPGGFLGGVAFSARGKLVTADMFGNIQFENGTRDSL